MTLVRRHLVGAVLMVLALAVGVALGSGPLSHDSLLPTTSPPAPAPADVIEAPSADDLAAEAAPGLYGSRLEGRSVALVATPGVGPETLTALTSGIEAAKGSVTARWEADRELVSASEKALIDTLGSQLVEQLDGRGADAEASAYERMGQLVGNSVATRKADGAIPEPDILTIRQSLAGADLLRHDGGQPRRAPLVLLVLGADLNDYVVEGLVSGIASRAAGVVVAASDRDGDLVVLDELGTATTVDGVTGAAGQLAAVLALARAEGEPGASYGASGSDGILPLG